MISSYITEQVLLSHFTLLSKGTVLQIHYVVKEQIGVRQYRDRSLRSR